MVAATPPGESARPSAEWVKPVVCGPSPEGGRAGGWGGMARGSVAAAAWPGAGAGLGPLAAPACGSRDSPPARSLARGLAEGQGRAGEGRVGGGGVRAAAAPGTRADLAWAGPGGRVGARRTQWPLGEGMREARAPSRAWGARGARGPREGKVSPGGES